MSMRINREAYQKLIDEDIGELQRLGNSLEIQHAIDVLRDSVARHYGSDNLAIGEAWIAAEDHASISQILGTAMAYGFSSCEFASRYAKIMPAGKVYHVRVAVELVEQSRTKLNCSTERQSIMCQHQRQTDIPTQSPIEALHDAALPLWQKRVLGAAIEWQEIDALLEMICGPMQRQKRCDACMGAGIVSWPDPTFGGTVSDACGTCEGTGYQKR